MICIYNIWFHYNDRLFFVFTIIYVEGVMGHIANILVKVIFKLLKFNIPLWQILLVPLNFS